MTEMTQERFHQILKELLDEGYITMDWDEEADDFTFPLTQKGHDFLREYNGEDNTE